MIHWHQGDTFKFRVSSYFASPFTEVKPELASSDSIERLRIFSRLQG
ncbi:MAG: hypothetical protein ACI96M_003321 [Candidatus Azotimanducaceae bacterium]|jgi:hypothetical protein